MRRNFRRSRAFSLIEALLTVGIFAVLIALLYVGVQSALAASRRARCISNLRQVGAAMSLSIQENRQAIVSFRGGSWDDRLAWNNQCFLNGYLTDKEVFRCPDGENKYPISGPSWFWNGYGLNMFDPDGGEVPLTGKLGTGYIYRRSTATIEHPAAYLLIADSATPSAQKYYQTFRLGKAGTTDLSGLHLRHQGRANVFFLDGHVESIDRKRALDLGVINIH